MDSIRLDKFRRSSQRIFIISRSLITSASAFVLEGNVHQPGESISILDLLQRLIVFRRSGK